MRMQARVKRVALAGTAVSAPVLILVTALLYSADERYASLLEQLFSSIRFGEIGSATLFTLACILIAYCTVRFLWKRSLPTEEKAQKQIPQAAVLAPLALFCLVYLSFACSQFIQPAEGITQYSFWARKGFFQLLAVSIINVLIVQLALSRCKDGMLLRILLLVFCACSYLMIASAAYRMLCYIDYYAALTFLRVLVLWTLALLSLLLGGQILQLFKRNFPLFRYGFVVFCICYIILSLARVDYWIARYNLSQIKLTSVSLSERQQYELKELAQDCSLDAVPAFEEAGFLADHSVDLIFDYRSVVSKKVIEKAGEGRLSPRKWNYALARAKKSIAPQSDGGKEP